MVHRRIPDADPLGLDKDLLHYLEYGCVHAGPGRLDEVVRLAARMWPVISERYMASWIQKHPGTRPYYWWAVTGYRRERTDGMVHPFDDPEWLKSQAGFPDACELAWGRPRYIPAGFPMPYGSLETEAECLARLGELTEAEIASGHYKKSPSL